MSQYYTGLDVSMNETAVCTINDKGKVVFESSVPTHPKEIDNCLKTAGFPIEKMSLESGSMSHWLMKELLALGWKISCVDARSIATVLALKQNKTDRNDARGIAEAVRSYSSYIKEVYHKSQESVDLGTLLSARRSLVRQRTVLSNTMRGLLKTFGLCLGGSGVEKIPFLIHEKIAAHWPQSSTEKLAEVEDSASLLKAYPALALKSLLFPFITLSTEIKKIDRVLERTAKRDAVIKRLMTIPGVGYLTALTYKVVIDEPSRFKNARAVGAYLGMCPTMYASGQTKRQGRISKRGSSELRTLLAGAGFSLLVRCKKQNSLKTWGAKVQEKHGTKKAATAVGRKISVIMHQLWCNDSVFNPNIAEEKNPHTSI